MTRIGTFFTGAAVCLVVFLAGTSQLATAQGLTSGQLTFVHGLPGDDLDTDMTDFPNRLPVDVSIGIPGSLNVVFQNVSFGTITQPITLAPGTYQIQVSLADLSNPGQGTAVLTDTVPVRAFQSQTYVAHTSPTAAIDGTLFQNPRGFLGFLNARVVVRHTANAGPVDASFNSLLGFPGTAGLNISSGNQSTPADLLLGPYTVRLNPAGNPLVNLIPPTFQFLSPWSTYYYYAVGTPENETFTVLIQRVPPSFGF